ncbi:MAG: methyltransferase domain-containing protein [Psychroflexus sp.]
MLKKQNALNGKVLHFSPSRSLYRIFKQDVNLKYYSSDFENEFLAEYKLDITQIDMPDNSFDTIICYHILEHIIEDQKAIAELKRILKPNGQCFIQTPFKSGEIFEDFRLTSPSERLEAFGQEDHVRIYSLDGLIDRLEEQGLKIKCLDFKEELIPNGLLQENILIATK